MKAILFFPLIILLSFSEKEFFFNSSYFSTDTTIITHLLDGNINEWPVDKFNVDKTTKIRYATDNDKDMLFLALAITDNNLQQKIVQQGMNLYLDTKGKKKENHGVAFPIGGSSVDFATSLSTMKLFGFANNEIQDVKKEGTVNIALTWDSLYVMYIEYNIPLKMLETENNKVINIGWKINQDEATTNNTQPVATSSTIQGRPAGGRNSGSRTASPSKIDQISPSGGFVRAQSFWTTYVIKL